MSKTINLIIKIIILIFSIYFISKIIDFKELEINILKYNYLFFVLIIGLLSFLLSTLRWSLILDKLIQPQKFTKLMYILSIQSLSGNFIPSLLNEGVRIYLSKIIKMSTSDSATSVIVDRVFGFFAKGIFIVISFLLFSFLFLDLKYFLIIFFFIVFSSILIFFSLDKILEIFSNFLRFIKPNKLREFLKNGHSFVSIFLENKNEASKPLAISLALQLLQIISFYLISKSLFEEISIIPILILLPTISFISALPITFNGWGVRELLFIYFFNFFNYSEETTFIASILFGLVSAIIPIVVLSILYPFKIHKNN